MTGGAEIAVKEITRRITDIEFDMVTMRFDKSHSKFERVGNINVYRIGGGLGYLSKIMFIPQAVLFALKRRYDLYWCIMTYMLFPAVLARGAKYILTLQDGDPFTHVFDRWFIVPFRPLLLSGFRHATKVQAISNFLADWARRMEYTGKTYVIPNGVNFSQFFNPEPKIFDPNKVVLITVSRLVEKNGVADIIRSLNFLPKDVRLRILGSGPLKPSLVHLVKKLGLEGRVDFIGYVDNDELPRHLFHADIFVRPSLSEGQGIAFIEAMAAGLPVIATPVGGIPDFLKDPAIAGQVATGLFCKPNDSKSIAKAVEQLIEDESLRKRIVRNALQMVREKYDWDLIAQEMKSKVFGI